MYTYKYKYKCNYKFPVKGGRKACHWLTGNAKVGRGKNHVFVIIFLLQMNSLTTTMTTMYPGASRGVLARGERGAVDDWAKVLWQPKTEELDQVIKMLVMIILIIWRNVENNWIWQPKTEKFDNYQWYDYLHIRWYHL